MPRGQRAHIYGVSRWNMTGPLPTDWIRKFEHGVPAVINEQALPITPTLSPGSTIMRTHITYQFYSTSDHFNPGYSFIQWAVILRLSEDEPTPPVLPDPVDDAWLAQDILWADFDSEGLMYVRDDFDNFNRRVPINGAGRVDIKAQRKIPPGNLGKLYFCWKFASPTVSFGSTVLSAVLGHYVG